MGKELVDFYTQPHTGMLFIYPIEYRFVNIYSFPISCVLAFNGELQGRICYYGYEQRNAIVAGDIVWFERVSKQLDELLNEQLLSSRELLSKSDEAMLQLNVVKGAVFPNKLLYTHRESLKRSFNFNTKLILYKYFPRVFINDSLFNATSSKESSLLYKQLINSKEKDTNINHQLIEIAPMISDTNLQAELKEHFKLKNTTVNHQIYSYEGVELLSDISNQLIQLHSYTMPTICILLDKKINGLPKYNRTSRFDLGHIFSELNTTRALSFITKNLTEYIAQMKNFSFEEGFIESFKSILRESDLNLISNEKAERYIKKACIHQTLESYIRDLLGIQRLNGVITFDINLKQLVFNKLVDKFLKDKNFETYKPWNTLAKFEMKEMNILQDIIYLYTTSTFATVFFEVFTPIRLMKTGVSNFKYYAFRNKNKVFRAYSKHLKTGKEKPSELLVELLLMSILKFRDTTIHDMDYGCIRAEHTSEETVIPLANFLVDKKEKETILQTLRFAFNKIATGWQNMRISLEAIELEKEAYRFYITLTSEVGQKMYFDFGHELMSASSTEKILSVYNDMVCISKNYTELYNSIIEEFEVIEKTLTLLSTTQHVDKIKLSDITGDLYLQDKLKNVILLIQQLADKLKLTNIDLTSDELEKLKESLLVDKFVLNELYHRWYFLPADGPYDEMILPQDYPYADKPVNGINEHPFPQGADKATREIPVDIDILTNVIDFCFNLWEANIFLYGGFTPQQAIKHFVNLVYEWLAKYVPTKIDKIPEYYPEDYEIYDNPDTEREDYWRLYRWIRWYAEAIVMNVPKEDEIKLKGNTYIKKLLEDLIKYFEDHHGIFGPPGTKVIDKIKGLRHKWLDKYNII